MFPEHIKYPRFKVVLLTVPSRMFVPPSFAQSLHSGLCSRALYGTPLTTLTRQARAHCAPSPRPTLSPFVYLPPPSPHTRLPKPELCASRNSVPPALTPRRVPGSQPA